MNYGLNISASALGTSLYKLDVLANNLANAETVGFKPAYANTKQRDAARIEDRLNLPSHELLEKLGAGVTLMPNMTSSQQGAIQYTGQDLDIAVRGEGFLVVRSPDPTKPGEVRLSRDGRLMRGAGGQLVQAGNAQPVLDVNDRPITLPDGVVEFDSAGNVKVNGETIARLQLAMLPEGSVLDKRGNGLIAAQPGAIAKRRPAAGEIVPRSIERSGVDPIKTMVAITAVERSIAASAKMIQIEDEMMNRAISTFGKVS